MRTFQEIQFRVWDMHDKEMSQSYTLSELANQQPGVFIYDGYETRYERLVPMQCTGLQDQKGNDVYEGDIVKCWVDPTDTSDHPTWFRNKQKANPKRYNHVIVFHEGGFGMKHCNSKSAKTYPIGHLTNQGENGNHISKFVVLGNIYQHPEILTNLTI